MKNITSKIILFILFFVINLFVVESVNAISVGVKPTELSVEGKIGQRIEKEILVFNTGDEPSMYNVSSDEYGDRVTVVPEDFRLEPEGNQVVKVSIKSWSPENFYTNLSIVARPLGVNGMPTAGGVKIPVDVVISGLIIRLALGIVFGLCFLALVMLKLNKKSKIIINQTYDKQE